MIYTKPLILKIFPNIVENLDHTPELQGYIHEELFRQVTQKEQHPDEDGFVWLCNINKNGVIPREYADERGCYYPQFDIRTPFIPPFLEKKVDKTTITKLKTALEGIYVRYNSQGINTTYTPVRW